MYSNFEVTKREILSSIIIVLVMLIFGFFLHSKIQQNTFDKNEIYNKALKIDNDAEMFSYGMKTSVGNAFVSGSFSVVDPVSYPAVAGEFLYISKETQKYTMHTRTVTYTDSNGKTKTKTETYWTWDRVDFESKKSKNILFENVNFDISKFDLPDPIYLQMDRKGLSNIRYIYYGIKSKFTGTILASLKNNSIYHIKNEKSRIQIYFSNLEDTYNKHLNKGTVWLVLFWIGWIILTGILIVIYYHFENNWLE